MTKQEILAVTELDTEACAKLNRLVHEKLGKCWHEWERANPLSLYFDLVCRKCSIAIYYWDKTSPVLFPDYCHSIADAWAIKDWLNTQ